MTTIEYICDNPQCPDAEKPPTMISYRSRWEADAHLSMGIASAKNHKDENCPACGEPGRREWA